MKKGHDGMILKGSDIAIYFRFQNENLYDENNDDILGRKIVLDKSSSRKSLSPLL